jgi:hypothetical protein
MTKARAHRRRSSKIQYTLSCVIGERRSWRPLGNLGELCQWMIELLS